jgi:hypothetical protein
MVVPASQVSPTAVSDFQLSRPVNRRGVFFAPTQRLPRNRHLVSGRPFPINLGDQYALASTRSSRHQDAFGRSFKFDAGAESPNIGRRYCHADRATTSTSKPTCGTSHRLRQSFRGTQSLAQESGPVTQISAGLHQDVLAQSHSICATGKADRVLREVGVAPKRDRAGLRNHQRLHRPDPKHPHG